MMKILRLLRLLKSIIVIISPLIKHKVFCKVLRAFFIIDSKKFCTEMMDITVQLKLNATDNLSAKRKTTSNVSQKIAEINEISDKVLLSSDIKIGVAGNRKRKIAYFKTIYNVNDRFLYFRKMYEFVKEIDTIYKKPY